MDCKSCNAGINSNVNFCNECGGKVIRNKLTLRNLFEDTIERFFNYDNKFLQTFIKLFTKPEEVIDGYINGARKKHVDALSYYAIAITFTGLYIYILTNFLSDSLTSHFLSDYGTSESQEMQTKQFDFMTKYSSLVMMFYIPLYAILAKIVFFNKKKFNFTELIVVFLYIQAQISIVSAVLTITLLALGMDFMLTSLLSGILMIVYGAYCLKRLYELSTPGIILRTMGFLGIFVLVCIIGGIGFAIWMIFTESGQEMIEAQKAAIEAQKLKS